MLWRMLHMADLMEFAFVLRRSHGSMFTPVSNMALKLVQA